MFLSNENVYTEQHFAVSYRQQTIGNVPLNYDTTSLRLYTKIVRDKSYSPLLYCIMKMFVILGPQFLS